MRKVVDDAAASNGAVVWNTLSMVFSPLTKRGYARTATAVGVTPVRLRTNSSSFIWRRSLFSA